LTSDDVVEYVKKQLTEWDYEDVVRAARGRCKLGAFILASCLIDHLAYFYSPIGNKNSGSGPRFKSFVSVYLRRYNDKKLYKALRCHLVHNYSEGGSYLFTHDRPNLHLQRDSKSGKSFVNLEDFLGEIQAAMVQFFDDAKRGGTAKGNSGRDVNIRDNIVKRFSDTGICGLVPAIPSDPRSKL